MKKILYLLNPRSSDGRAKDIWQKSREKFPQLPQKPNLMTEIASLPKFIEKEKPDLIAICGGDGTINKVCQAVIKIKKRPLLTILPMGTGNALSFCLGVETLSKAMAVLQIQPKTIIIDIMQTNIPEIPIGIFNISAGFDARIVSNRVSYNYIGIKSYIISGIRSFFSHPESEIMFTIDKTVTLKATAGSLVVANSPVVGQNLLVSPRARLNDGLLDCTLFSTKYAYLQNLRLRGFKHPFYSELGKVHFKASHLSIQGEPYVQIDGDPVVRQEGIQVSVLPSQIAFLRNFDEQIEQNYKSFVI